MSGASPGWDGSRIERLRAKLGSVVRPLSRGDLARLLSEGEPPERNATQSSVRRWELEGVEPPYWAAAKMARLAGESFEAFALGAPSAAPAADRPSIPGVEVRTEAEERAQLAREAADAARARRRGSA